jgi:hypothetical protein
MPVKSTLTTLERILERTEVQDNGCWYWMGGLNKDRYGLIKIGRRKALTLT